ncbi:MAG: tetraacyldisaccharide 4'-kinase [Fimbriimonadaceae bacterium]
MTDDRPHADAARSGGFERVWSHLGWGAVGLAPLSALYAAGWLAYLGLYQSGLLRPKRPHRPVVCVGNLRVGGSGKSPVTMHVYEVLRGLGREVVVSASGYGSPASQAATLAPEGDLRAAEWGDEPSMFRLAYPEMPVIVGRDRVRAAEICAAEFPNATLLLDDGFQHLPLAKDITILLDAPGANGLCLPAGPYREPRRIGRRRASTVLPGTFQVQAEPLIFFEPRSGKVGPKESERVQLLCAIARPERFVEAVRRSGRDVGRCVLTRDHDTLTKGNLLQPFDPDVPIAVTEKDWVKLRERTDLDRFRFWVARHRVRVVPEERFAEFLHVQLASS